MTMSPDFRTNFSSDDSDDDGEIFMWSESSKQAKEAREALNANYRKPWEPKGFLGNVFENIVVSCVAALILMVLFFL